MTFGIRQPVTLSWRAKNLPLVGKLLGHRRRRITAGYAHLDDAHLVEAVERIARVIIDAMKEADIELKR